MYTHRSSLYLSICLSGLIWLLGTPATSWAEIKCGDTISPGTKVTLTKDLMCGDLDPDEFALTLQGPGTVLNLGEHRVDCENSGGLQGGGVRIIGSGATLKKGLVTHCPIGVLISGTGSHSITKVKATKSSTTGFRVAFGSENNRLKYNTAMGTMGPVGAFEVFSTGNLLARNLALKNDVFGITASGSGLRENRFIGNVVKKNRGGRNGYFARNRGGEKQRRPKQ